MLPLPKPCRPAVTSASAMSSSASSYLYEGLGGCASERVCVCVRAHASVRCVRAGILRHGRRGVDGDHVQLVRLGVAESVHLIIAVLRATMPPFPWFTLFALLSVAGAGIDVGVGIHSIALPIMLPTTATTTVAIAITTAFVAFTLLSSICFL